MLLASFHYRYSDELRYLVPPNHTFRANARDATYIESSLTLYAIGK